MDADSEKSQADPKKSRADPKKSQAMRCFRRFLETPRGRLWGPWCVSWSKMCSKRVPKGGLKGVKRELKNRTPAKYGKCGFDTGFIRFGPRRHFQKSYIFGVLWGTKVGSKDRSTRKPLRSMPLEALVTSWRLFGRPVGF